MYQQKKYGILQFSTVFVLTYKGIYKSNDILPVDSRMVNPLSFDGASSANEGPALCKAPPKGEAPTPQGSTSQSVTTQGAMHSFSGGIIDHYKVFLPRVKCKQVLWQKLEFWILLIPNC